MSTKKEILVQQQKVSENAKKEATKNTKKSNTKKSNTKTKNTKAKNTKKSNTIKASTKANKEVKQAIYQDLRNIIANTYTSNKLTLTHNKDCDASLQARINNHQMFSFVIPKKDKNFRCFVKLSKCSDKFNKKYSKCDTNKNKERVIHFDTITECKAILNDILQSLYDEKILTEIKLVK